MSKPLLQLSNISKRFPPSVQSGKRFRAFWQLLWQGRAQGGTRVLHDISFQINPGESLGIIGANGAGKSTLLKIISGVLSPSSGTMVKNGSIAALLMLAGSLIVTWLGYRLFNRLSPHFEDFL